jgi:hypothetical protein
MRIEVLRKICFIRDGIIGILSFIGVCVVNTAWRNDMFVMNGGQRQL